MEWMCDAYKLSGGFSFLLFFPAAPVFSFPPSLLQKQRPFKA